MDQMTWEIRFIDEEDDAKENNKTEMNDQSVEIVNVILPESELTQSLQSESEEPLQQYQVQQERLQQHQIQQEPLQQHQVQQEPLQQHQIGDKKHHHSGPYNIKYIDKNEDRHKCFYKRKGTLLKNVS